MKIIFTEEDIVIQEHNGKHLVSWNIEEWEEDSNVVFSIANAIHLAHTDPKQLKHLLKLD